MWQVGADDEGTAILSGTGFTRRSFTRYDDYRVTIGLDAAAAVQRSRIVMRTLEDSLLCAQSFGGRNQRYYGFVAENGSEPSLSFASRLPESFPRSRKFGDLHVRRVTFAVEPGPETGRQLVLRQSPLLMDLDPEDWEDLSAYP